MVEGDHVVKGGFSEAGGQCEPGGFLLVELGRGLAGGGRTIRAAFCACLQFLGRCRTYRSCWPPGPRWLPTCFSVCTCHPALTLPSSSCPVRPVHEATIPVTSAGSHEAGVGHPRCPMSVSLAKAPEPQTGLWACGGGRLWGQRPRRLCRFPFINRLPFFSQRTGDRCRV